MAKILLVEDDKELVETLRVWIRTDGFEVEACMDGESALEILRMSAFDVIVLDWDLPGISGMDVLKTYRKEGGQAPIIFLTGKSQIEEKEAGLDGGADDYLTKPFKVKELSARLRALLRRRRAVGESQLSFADLKIDPGPKICTRGGEELKLAPREFALLEFLMRRRDETFSAHELLMHVWPSDSEASDQTVRTCIKRIRQIIDYPDRPSYIVNTHGHGYCMNPEMKTG
ncbi:MAG: response regulator transcription factor [Candidatus Obscuribacter sp.]|nr:response regulator transcription factor [Candidatus Obscuribacter sp.]